MKLEGLRQDIFLQRYSMVGETEWDQCARRVADTIASVEINGLASEWGDKFFNSIRTGDFMPGGRILFGAGRRQFNMLNCFHKDTRVFTDEGWKKITDINIGDFVLTHQGRLRAVTDKFSQGHRESLYKIKINGLGQSLALRVTGDHKIMTPNGYCRADKLKEGDLVSTGFIDPNKFGEVRNRIDIIDWLDNVNYKEIDGVLGIVCKRAGQLNYGTGKIIPDFKGNKCKSSINIDSDFGMWAGYYLSEGSSITAGSSVVFTFNKDEIEYINHVVELGKKLFNLDATVEPSEAGEWTQVKFHSSILNEFHKNFFGPTFDSKRIPYELYQANRDTQLALLGGLIRGDGTKRQSKYGISYDLTCANPHMIYDAYLIAKHLGFDCSFGINGYKKEDHHADQASLHIRHFMVNNDLVNTVEFTQHTNSTSFIKSIELEKYNDEVWDITVEDDHSLIAEGVIVSNCYRLHCEDTVESIGKMIQDTYLISCGGGGIGFNFSDIRPKGDDIQNIQNSAPGAVSVMKMVNEIGYHVKSGKNRRTALIAILNVDHPDLLEFLKVKLDQHELNNFNISVGITNEFIEAVKKNKSWTFKFNGRVYKPFSVRRTTDVGTKGLTDSDTIQILALDKEDALGRAEQHHKVDHTTKFSHIRETEIKAKDIWETLVKNAWASGDPGIYNIDFSNSFTNVSYFEDVNSPNPCGEIPLPAYGNCCLGHVNLSNMYDEKKNDVHWKKLAKTIRIGIRFLDNVLAANHYPIPECRTVGEKSRRIGLGVTGLHYLLLKLGFVYGDEKCLEFLDRLFATFRNEAYKASIEIAKEKGSFPAFDAEKYSQEGFFQQLPPRIQSSIKRYGIRNAVLLTIAPCGTNSMVLGVSSGIEPIFAPVYKRTFRENNVLRTDFVADALFTEFYTSAKDMDHFVGAYDVSVEQHLQVQATIQKYIDSAISKTTNLPKDFKCNDLSDAILDYASYVKGFTIYRSGSKGNEPLEPVDITDEEKLQNAMKKAGIDVKSIEACRSGVCEI